MELKNTGSLVYAGYDEEARYFEATVREEKRAELKAKVLELVKVPFESQVTLLKEHCLQGFKDDMESFDSKLGFSTCAARYKTAHPFARVIQV